MKKILLLAGLLLMVQAAFAQGTGDKSGLKAGENSKSSQFPGGDDSLNCYLTRNLDPLIVSDKNLKAGSVYVTFNVGSDGKTSEITIVTGHSQPVDEEIVRVVSGMPEWIPAEQLVGYPKGKWIKVPSTYELQVTIPFSDQCHVKKKKK